MSCLLSFTVITLFVAGIQIVMLTIFSSGTQLPISSASQRAVLCVNCKLSITVLLKGASFLSVYKDERSPYLPCLPQHVYFRLLNEKCTKILLRFVGTWGIGVMVVQFFHRTREHTRVRPALPCACVILNLFTRCTPGRRLRNQGPKGERSGQKADGSGGSVESIPVSV